MTFVAWREFEPILTDRLQLTQLTDVDADFIVELLNSPAFLRFIGDRGVRSHADALVYIANGPRHMMQEHGFALLRVALRTDAGQPLGICGVLKRDALDLPDVGFAFLPQFWSQGYAFEAADAAIRDARQRVPGLARVLAIASPDNEASIRLLKKLGFTHQQTMKLTPTATDEVELFANDPSPPASELGSL
jgi:ribosomal-protein-alanine N-acetyltransferase